MVSWSAYQRGLIGGWLQTGLGGFWVDETGQLKAYGEELGRSGVLARFPTYADLGALAQLGRDRLLEQYPAMTAAAFREKLRTAFDVWAKAGTPEGVLLELHDALGDLATICDNGLTILTGNGLWANLEDGGSNFNFFHDAPVGGVNALDPSAPSFWNRFIVWLRTTTATPPGTIGDSSPEADLARRVVKAWKSGHSKLARFVIVGTSTKVWGGHDFNATNLSQGTLLTWGEPGLTWSSSPAAAPAYWSPPEGQ